MKKPQYIAKSRPGWPWGKGYRVAVPGSPSKGFTVKEYGSWEKAHKAAIVFRDEQVKLKDARITRVLENRQLIKARKASSLKYKKKIPLPPKLQKKLNTAIVKLQPKKKAPPPAIRVSVGRALEIYARGLVGLIIAIAQESARAIK